MNDANAEETHIERACARLVQQSALSIDRHQFRDVSLLFTADGSFQRVRGDVLSGRDAIARGLDRPPEHVTIHHLSPTLVHVVSAGEARGTTSFVAYGPSQDSGGPIAALAAAYWEDLFRKTSDGWKIAERRTRVLTKVSSSS